MDIKVGDIFKSSSDDMAVLESQDRRRQILTEVNTLKSGSFYLKKENGDL